MAGRTIIAVDLGAESGRVMQVAFDGKSLRLEELHRFPNIPVQARDTLYWDVLSLWHGITEGLAKAPSDAASIGVDTWGVDFALLDKNGKLLSSPVHYRDKRTEGMFDWVFARIPRRKVFEHTGIQFMIINTLYQVASMVRDRSPILDAAHTFLTIADLFNYWLSGSKTCEFTFASTTQFFNPVSGGWDRELLSTLGIQTGIFPEIVQPGTRLGDYRGIPVIAPACHDTGSAVVGVPATSDNYAYISSGTWSLIGIETDAPIINDASYTANVTNEGGAYGRNRLLKNIMGLWLVQQSRNTWRAQGKDYSYAQLTDMAATATPFSALIDPDDPSFLPPGDMPARIREFCKTTNQPVPESEGQIIRIINESLALKYRLSLDSFIELTGKTIERLHIIGGGSQNTLLNQMTANAIARPVVAGPIEAAAHGNAIVQLIALGELADIAQARAFMSETLDLQTYEPQDTAAFEEQYERFKSLLTTD